MKSLEIYENYITLFCLEKLNFFTILYILTQNHARHIPKVIEITFNIAAIKEQHHSVMCSVYPEPDPEPNPDPLVRGTDPGIRIRIRTKMSRIPRNTYFDAMGAVHVVWKTRVSFYVFLPCGSDTEEINTKTPFPPLRSVVSFHTFYINIQK
jgi:hypothetical protein